MHTRHLHGSITPWHDNDTAVVGTNVVYARIQNQGGKTPPMKSAPATGRRCASTVAMRRRSTIRGRIFRRVRS
ncbi:Mu-like prophage protein gpG [Cedecea neteri]|uniref:Mu-like prophage protein gpG n=1 Tax=Cedecea neteri TaxID=158822 RepID=A0A2X3L1A3_9ENTR|nr:Mu-like prophage protein gpG [Cedecea neteri]